MSDDSKNKLSPNSPSVSVGGQARFPNGDTATINGSSTQGQNELLDSRIRYERQEASDEARFEALSSIRENIRTLPEERQEEMFREFIEAAQSGNIGILADTVANLALGGHEYKTAGAVVNRSLDRLPRLEDDPALFALWQEHKPHAEKAE